jgi:phage-related protein
MVSIARDKNSTYHQWITFGGVSTYDYECAVDGSNTFAAPQREYEEVEVDGRNGVLHLDKERYANTDLKFDIFFPNLDDYSDWKNKIMPLTGYQRLEDSHHPDEFRYAVLTGGLEPTVAGEGLTYCSVELNFSAKPQRFLKTGEQYTTLTQSGAIFNPTAYDAKPQLIVYGYGTIQVNDISMTIDSHSHDYLLVDSDLMDCYVDDINMNQFVSGDFPVLHSGDNPIIIDSTITRIDILPRWWRL